MKPTSLPTTLETVADLPPLARHPALIAGAARFANLGDAVKTERLMRILTGMDD